MGDVFAPRGAMSARDACRQVFEGLKVGEWIEVGDLAHRVAELTEVSDWSIDSVRSAAWAANEALTADEIAATEWYMGGYRRLDTEGQLAAARKRQERLRKAHRRTVSWASAALANPEVTGPDRHQMTILAQVQIRQKELEERRAARPGPPPT